MLDFVSRMEQAPLGKTHLFSLGQAGFIIKNSIGKFLAIDPYLSDCVERVESSVGYKRLLPKILDPKDICLDVLICTHFHRDHYDIDSVPTLMRGGKTLLLCPEDCRVDTVNEKIDSAAVRIIKPSDHVEKDGFKITFINCDHGAGAPMAVGVIVETDRLKIVEVGDTCLRLDRVSEITSGGNVDVLIAPINGAYGNLNESECVRLAMAVEPKLVIPCHYGMFKAHGGDPKLFCKIMSEQSQVNYTLMEQGEKLTIGEWAKNGI